jgi:hypothetical protein
MINFLSTLVCEEQFLATWALGVTNLVRSKPVDDRLVSRSILPFGSLLAVLLCGPGFGFRHLQFYRCPLIVTLLPVFLQIFSQIVPAR